MEQLRTLFSGLLSNAAREEGVTLDALVFNYVTSMLVSFTRSDALGTQEGMPILAWYHRDAVNSRGSLRFNAYRRLGDTALFLSGFFSDHVESTGGMGYYIDMGCMAYGHAAESGMRPVMDELSSKFSPLVCILNSASRMTPVGREHTLSQMYELYTRVQTPGCWGRMVARGHVPLIVPARG